MKRSEIPTSLEPPCLSQLRLADRVPAEPGSPDGKTGGFLHIPRVRIAGLVSLLAILALSRGEVVPAEVSGEAHSAPARSDEGGPRCASGAVSLSDGGYEFTTEGTRHWTGSNVRHRLRMDLSAAGLRLREWPGSRPAWEWSLALVRIGAPGDTRPAGEAWPTVEGNRADLLRGRLREWLVNSRKGIEHGLEIPDDAGAGEIQIDYLPTVDGSPGAGGSGDPATTLSPKAGPDGVTLIWVDASGSPILRHQDLQAFDAEDRPVEVRWERIEGGDLPAGAFRLVVAGADHRFPVRVVERLVSPKSGGDGRPEGTPAEAGGFTTLAAPGNDACGGAETIPGAGPFPYLSALADITEATTVGDPPAPSCQSNRSRSVWYRFVPDSRALYTFSVCEDAPTATTVPDTVLALYAAGGDCAGLQEVAGGCDDDGCAIQDFQSVLTDLDLSAGTVYYIVAWQFGTAAPAPGEAQVQLSVSRRNLPGPAPPNDQCPGAESIPGAGPFPYLTSVTADISSAGTAGDPPPPSCQANVSRSIWYRFTPAVAGRYRFSVCADAPTGTTVDDTVLALYAAAGTCTGLVQVAGGCDDDSCASELAQSVIAGVDLSAGTSYYLVVWEYGTSLPLTGNTAVQVRVSQVTGPPNDRCADAIALVPGRPETGTTLSATDDTRLPSGSACFTGIGQTASTAPGRDVAYRFTAETAGKYSFRVTGFDSSRNAVLYVAADCPAGSPPAEVSACRSAANRNATAPAEEVRCLSLDAGEVVYVYVDEHAVTAGGGFALEVDPCVEESEPNDSPAAGGEATCGAEGAIAPAGDIDFFRLGSPAAGSRVFALADGVAGNSTDFDLRITGVADTLEYDDLNNDLPFGPVSPNVAGTPLPGSAAYLRVSHYSSAAVAEPYRLFAAVQPPSSQATAEIEPNDTTGQATAAANQYFAGALATAADVDFFAFSATAGERIQLGLDLDPSRDGTAFNGALALLDGTGAVLVQVNDPASTASTTPGTGNLAAATPYAPSEGVVHRIGSSGTYFARVSSPGVGFGDYLLSVAHDCRVLPGTDLAVTQVDTPDPVVPGDPLSYTITIQNLGSQPAASVTLRDDPPAGAALLAIVPSQGSCTGSAPVFCDLGALAPSGTATVSLGMLAPVVPGAVANLARVSSLVVDPQPANDSAVEGTTVGSLDGDHDGVPDAGDCAPADPSLWGVPGEATGLAFPLAGDAGAVQWNAPAAPGGTQVLYDLLRSTVPGDFSSAVCVATGLTATTAADPAAPTPKYHYLIRTRNGCGASLGYRSDGTPRTAPPCQ